MCFDPENHLLGISVSLFLLYGVEKEHTTVIALRSVPSVCDCDVCTPLSDGAEDNGTEMHS